MRHALIAASALADLVVNGTVLAAAQDPTSGGGVEQRYCTPSGPFLIRFEEDRAAGIFADLPPRGAEPPPTLARKEKAPRVPGAMAGALSDRALEGTWTLAERRGAIRMTFSEDWSSFTAAYTVETAPEEWTGGWTGYLPPAGDPDDFVIDGERHHCN